MPQIYPYGTGKSAVYYRRCIKMKTKCSSLLFFISTIALIMPLFICCSKQSPENNTVDNKQGQESLNTNISSSSTTGTALLPETIPDSYLQDKFIEPKAIFTLDYTPYLPESEAAVINKIKAQNENTVNVQAQEYQSVIPGLRSVTEYKTDYSVKKATSIGTSLPAYMQQGNSSKIGTFTVEDWGPQGAIPSDVKRPSFYVLFSEPIVPLAALGEQSSVSPYMEIEPQLKGVFRWYGTSLLSFDATENCNPRQIYTIKLNPDIRAISGNKLSGATEFSTEAAPLEIEWFQPGYDWSIENKEYVSTYDVPPEAAKELRVQFNYDIDADVINEMSLITIGNKTAEFTVTQSLPDTVTYHISTPIPFETNVKLTITDGVNEMQSAQYTTLNKFALQSSYNSQTYGKYTNPVNIYMSHPLKSDTVLPNISTIPYMPIKEENIEVFGNSIVLYGLPVNFGDSYTILLNTGIEDIYGRKLSSVTKVETFVPDARSFVQFQNYGIQILEEQFPHKMLFEYQNIEEGSRYIVSKTATPLDAYRGYNSISIQKDTPGAVELKAEPRNTRVFEEIDLNPFLTDGNRAIRFEAAVRTKSNYDDSTYTNTNSTTIQITNLGVTARVGINKTVVLVSKLSDGKPVEDAEVYLYNGITKAALQNVQNGAFFAKSITDKNGLAVLEYDVDEAMKFFNRGDYSADTNPAIYVSTSSDSVTFFPESHSPWRDGVYYTSDIASALASQQKTFMFCDRGLYKPGETVTFRGIDRNRQAGSYTPYSGYYTIILEDSSWWDIETYDSQSGKTSESGGFYGSFTLPEDLEPGTYRIRYTRAGSTSDSYYDDPSIEINVAYFERLKFQAAVKMPSTPLIAGDNIPASLSASYLAGGKLASANYNANWFREPWYFTSTENEFKDFRFGPSDISENRSYIDDEEGNLNAEGKAELSCKTGGESLKGVPYRYRVSASVTDASNQQIATSGAAVVHPASFYVGVSKKLSASAYARTGEPIEFTYKLALPDGTAVSSRENVKNTILALAGEFPAIEITLLRTDWNLVKQQGIAGNVYSRYEKEEIVESSNSVKLEAEGTISVKPEKAGYHTLRVQTTDSMGRSVITDYTFFATGSGASLSASSIKLTPDQSQYNPGDTAHVLLESPLPSGDYLITMEREGIFTQEVRHFDSNVQVLDIPIARNYVPVVYLSICSYSVRTEPPHHEYGEKDVDKPQGYYGVTPVYINPYIKAFSLTIDTGSEAYRPGEEATITITATKGGKPLKNAEITLMAVDRGVLDLINYHVPDPISFYYNESNFPLCVKGGDDRNYLMDPVTYETKNLAGGDADSTGEDKIEERKDFNPTAVFEPALITDKDGKVVCKFKLPDTLTTYRLTAFGTEGELLALQEDEIAVKNPINVQQVLPRRLRVRDTAEMGVILTNLDGVPHEMEVSLRFTEPDSAVENGVSIKVGEAFVDGMDKHKVTVGAGNTVAVYFDAAAKEAGTVNAVFTTSCPGVLNERLVCPIIIEKPYIFETFSTTGVVPEDEENAEEFVIIPEFAEDGKGSIAITLDATRLGTLGSAVKYVFQYPYGCLEQQSAKVLPLILFEDYIDLFEMEMDEKITDIHSCVKSFFKSWADCQLNNGSFGYWSDSTVGNPFVTARIAHIIQLALEHGYKTSEIYIDRNRLIRSLRTFITPPKSNEEASRYNLSDHDKAYIYYVLSISGDRSVSETDLASLISDSQTPISTLAYVGLAAYSHFGNDSPIVKECFERTRSFIRPGTQGADITYPEMDDSFEPYAGTKDEQLALMIKFYSVIDPSDKMISRLIFTLLNNQKAGYWNDTATTATVFDAFYTVIKSTNLDNVDITAATGLGSTQLAITKFEGAASTPFRTEFQFSDDIFKGLKSGIMLPLTFSRSGTGSLYYTASLTYALPYEDLSARDEGIGISYIIYDDTTGEEIKPASSSSTVIELQSGRIYKAKLTISSSRARTFIALRSPVPSGAELLDSTFITTAMGKEDSNEEEYDWRYFNHSSIYDNEIQYFWDSFSKGHTSTTFKFRAVRKGVYPTPPVTAECMYEPEVFGRTEGYLYTIK